MMDFPDFSRVQYKRYGTPMRGYDTISCDPGAWTSLALISGKGQIYCGFVKSESANATENDHVGVELDGQAIGNIAFQTAVNCGLWRSYNYSIYMLVFDVVTPRVVVGLTPNYTFETTYEVKYWNAGALAFDVDIEIVYTLIQ